ncbi:MAG: NADPH:quinone reductase-like Zn-dependent oxidoreductase [Motiliproteus sp.]|jgi:NADPH:quinone reductase-like Zn-dependent oxidoreductase
MNELPATMRGVQLLGHGGMEMLQFKSDIPVPVPGPKDLLVRVTAAAVNNTDINTRIAWYSKKEGADADTGWSGQALQFPRIQGADVCGFIVAVGEQVNADRLGERVLIEPCLQEAEGETLQQPRYFGSECDGGFAEYVVIAARHAYKVDSKLSDIELASFPCSYSTAENMLTRADVKQAERVLITGASGGVGSAAIQLAKARGAYVLAITSPEKAQQLLELGADEVVPRNADLLSAIAANSIDVVIDLVAGPQFKQCLELLRSRGRYAASGAIGGAMVELDVRTLYLKDLSLFGCTVLEPQVFRRLIDYIEQGAISPVVAHTFALEEICEAQEQFLKKSHVGKIMLKV